MESDMPSQEAAAAPAYPKQPGVIFLLALAHAAALLVVYVGDQVYHFGLFRLGWIGLVCGQISLVAIFGALAPWPLLMRLSLACIAAAVGWILLISVLPPGSNSSAAWAAMTALQFAIVAGGSFLLRVFVRQAEGESPRALLGQYTIATLLAWTTLIAVVLGLLRLAFRWFGWDESVLRWEWFLHVQVIGLFNAALGLVGLASVIGSRRPRLRRIWGLVIAVVIVFHMPFLLDAIFRSVGAAYAELWGIGGVQAIATFMTLHIVRRAGGLAEQVVPLRQAESAC